MDKKNNELIKNEQKHSANYAKSIFLTSQIWWIFRIKLLVRNVLVSLSQSHWRIENLFNVIDSSDYKSESGNHFEILLSMYATETWHRLCQSRLEYESAHKCYLLIFGYSKKLHESNVTMKTNSTSKLLKDISKKNGLSGYNSLFRSDPTFKILKRLQSKRNERKTPFQITGIPVRLSYTCILIIQAHVFAHR